MKESEIKFEREDIHGIIPVGTYLAEAARRLGVRFVKPCDAANGEHHCEVEVIKGEDLLTARTATEKKYFKDREDAENFVDISESRMFDLSEDDLLDVDITEQVTRLIRPDSDVAQ